MDATNESHGTLSDILDELPQNKYDEEIIREPLEESKDDYWNTTDESGLKQDVLPRNLQKDTLNKNDSDERKIYAVANNECLNKKCLDDYIEKEDQLQSLSSSKNESVEQNIYTNLNEGAISNNSSSDEEVLQTRFPVQNEDECNSPNSSISFASISNKQNTTGNDFESKKPIVIQAKAHCENKITEYKIDDSNFETTKQEQKHEHGGTNKQAQKHEHRSTNEQAHEYEYRDTNDQEQQRDHRDFNEHAQKHDYHDIHEQQLKHEHRHINSLLKHEHQNIHKQSQRHEDRDTHKPEEESEHQTFSTDIANSLSIEADNSNLETESMDNQDSIQNKTAGLHFFNKINNKNKTSFEEINSDTNEKNFNQNIQNCHVTSPDAIINDFFCGSFDISTFKPEKNSTMIKDDKTIKKQNQTKKNKQSPREEKRYRGNTHKNINEKVHSGIGHTALFNDDKNSVDSRDVSVTPLKRKTPEKQTNSKKTKMFIGKNKDGTTNTTKMKSENKHSRSRSNDQQRRASSRSKYKERNFFNDFNMKKNEENKTKNYTPRIKSKEKDEIFKASTHKIDTSKRSRNLRSSSLMASKKIKEIEKLENDDSFEEIILDSEISCLDSSIKKIEDSFQSIIMEEEIFPKRKFESKLTKNKFHKEDNADIISLEGFQTCFEKEEKLERKKTRSNKSKSENIFHACQITQANQLKLDYMDSKKRSNSRVNQLNLFEEENEDTFESHQNKYKKAVNRQQSKNKKITENKLLEYGKKNDENSLHRNNIVNINRGVTTRSKKKTWDMLEKELLRESNDEPLTNDNVTKTVFLREKCIKRQNLKDIDLYSISDKSVMQISRPAKRSKYDGKSEAQHKEFKNLQTEVCKAQSDEKVPYKSKNILEKTIAAMERCTAKFIGAKEKFMGKEWIHIEPELGHMIDEMSIEQEAEFHSNVTFVKNENEQYVKNKIVAVLKQSSAKKTENSCRRTRYHSGENKYGFGKAEHLIKKSIVTETYSVKGNCEKNLPESQTLISSSDAKESDPWTKLIKELNLEQNRNENKSRDILTGIQSKNAFMYHEDVKHYSNIHSKESEKCEENEIDMEEREQDVPNSSLEKNSQQSNNMITRYDFNEQDYCNATNDTIAYKKADLVNVSTVQKIEKITRKTVTKDRQAPKMEKVKTSPKFKLQVKDGGIKFKRCNRSLSSSSEEESVKQKKDSKRKVKQKSTWQKYKRYLNTLFEAKNKLETDKEKMNYLSKEESFESNLVKDSNKQQKIQKGLIAKNDDDVFSISSSDSEPVNKGSGLLCDMFDERK